MLVANATLTSIDRPAGLDDYDGPEIQTNLWAGSTDAYVEQRTVRNTTGAGSDYQRKWTVYLDLAAPPVVVLIGDLLTWTQPVADGTTGTFQAPVMSDETRTEPDMPTDVQSRAFVMEPTSSTGTDPE